MEITYALQFRRTHLSGCLFIHPKLSRTDYVQVPDCYVRTTSFLIMVRLYLKSHWFSYFWGRTNKTGDAWHREDEDMRSLKSLGCWESGASVSANIEIRGRTSLKVGIHKEIKLILDVLRRNAAKH